MIHSIFNKVIILFLILFIYLNKKIVSTNRPKFPEYDKQTDRFCFETRTKQDRQITISVYIDIKQTNYIYKTSIEELIRNADEIIREVILFEKYFFFLISYSLFSIDLQIKVEDGCQLN